MPFDGVLFDNVSVVQLLMSHEKKAVLNLALAFYMHHEWHFANGRMRQYGSFTIHVWWWMILYLLHQLLLLFDLGTDCI